MDQRGEFHTGPREIFCGGAAVQDGEQGHRSRVPPLLLFCEEAAAQDGEQGHRSEVQDEAQ